MASNRMSYYDMATKEVGENEKEIPPRTSSRKERSNAKKKAQDILGPVEEIPANHVPFNQPNEAKIKAQEILVTEEEIPATDVPSNQPNEANEAGIVLPRKNMNRAIWTIVAGVALPCIPIIIVVTILLTFIFTKRVTWDASLQELYVPPMKSHLSFAQKALQVKKNGGEHAYYVNYSATTITTIASWTSRVIPYLTGSIMALVGFYAARHLVIKSQNGDELQLPSPEQLTLLISVLSGNGFGPLKDAILHRVVTKQKLVHPLPAAIAALAVITVLGILIPIIDTWFGIATAAGPVTVLRHQPRANYSSNGFWRDLDFCPTPNAGAISICDHYPQPGSKPCGLTDPDAYWPCNLNYTTEGNGTMIIYDTAEAASIVLGVSEDYVAQNYTDNDNITYFYFADPSQGEYIDYMAKTVAITSQCQPMSLKQCNADPNRTSNYNLFSCTPGFTGSTALHNLDTSGTDAEGVAINTGLAFSGNPQLTQVNGQLGFYDNGQPSKDTLPQMYTTNPLYYGVWATGFPAPNDESGKIFTDNPYFYYDDTNMGGVWFLNCSSTVYNVTYTWVNGSVVTFDKTAASPDLAAIFSGPFAMASYGTQIITALYSIASVASARVVKKGSVVPNADSIIASAFAQEFSKSLMAYSNGAIGFALSDLEQTRANGQILTRVPYLPLYLLLTSKLIYVLAVIILAIGAYCFTHPAETEIVKAQLTVKGLAAAHFDKPDLMQQNVVKQIQSRLDDAKEKATSPSSAATSATAGTEGKVNGPTNSGVKDAVTTLNQSTSSPQDARVGLVRAVDGSWQFGLRADGVWKAIKPVVKDVLLKEANDGDLGAMGDVVKLWK